MENKEKREEGRGGGELLRMRASSLNEGRVTGKTSRGRNVWWGRRNQQLCDVDLQGWSLGRRNGRRPTQGQEEVSVSRMSPA